eukprot:TRINITY_DN2502_c0_g1_i1.p1 TRINITY_DN2502_c0_g1~~TRINITY_DN2502_c0_g1_i1.p1  ORF type:complete len:1304 (+),score=415.99 TRINITY_DN2502_c0_g1_i1:129-4040(+)
MLKRYKTPRSPAGTAKKKQPLRNAACAPPSPVATGPLKFGGGGARGASTAARPSKPVSHAPPPPAPARPRPFLPQPVQPARPAAGQKRPRSATPPRSPPRKYQAAAPAAAASARPLRLSKSPARASKERAGCAPDAPAPPPPAAAGRTSPNGPVPFVPGRQVSPDGRPVRFVPRALGDERKASPEARGVARPVPFVPPAPASPEKCHSARPVPFVPVRAPSREHTARAMPSKFYGIAEEAVPAPAPAPPPPPAPVSPPEAGGWQTAADGDGGSPASADSGIPAELLPPHFSFPSQRPEDFEMWEEDLNLEEQGPFPPTPPSPPAAPPPPGQPRTRVPTPDPPGGAEDAAHIARMTEVFRASARPHDAALGARLSDVSVDAHAGRRHPPPPPAAHHLTSAPSTITKPRPFVGGNTRTPSAASAASSAATVLQAAPAKASFEGPVKDARPGPQTARPVPFVSPAPPRPAAATAKPVPFAAAPRDPPDPLAEFPPDVAAAFRRRGIKSFYEWQREVLGLPAVREGGNLVFSLPTSGGKSLVAEVLLLRAICRRRSGVLIMPYVALVEEKLAALAPFAKPLGIEVLASAGMTTQVPQPNRGFLIICTIEKANALVNLMLAEGRLEEIGCVVVDELHMVGEEGRGATLELLLTKLLTAAPRCQLVGMSATIPNLAVLAAWLRADLYTSDFRPVSLRSFLCRSDPPHDVGKISVTAADGALCRTYPKDPADPEGVAALVGEVVPAHCVLVFCRSKKECERVSRCLAETLPAPAREAKRFEREALTRDMKNVVAGSIDKALEATIRSGVAYHHAGLTSEERVLVEEAFRAKTLNVICCTSTLAAGVNLPARRVIIKHPYTGPAFLTKSRYLQMCGRAGRAGFDDCGESYLIAQPKDLRKSTELMTQAIEELASKVCTPEAVERVLTDVVATGIASTKAALSGFIASLLYMKQAEASGGAAVAALERLFNAKLHELSQSRIIKIDAKEPAGEGAGSKGPVIAPDSARASDGTDTQNTASAEAAVAAPNGDLLFSCTAFGQSTFKAGLSAGDARRLKAEMTELQRVGLILAHDLHMLYYLTPIKEIFLLRLDWNTYAALYPRMSEMKKRIAAQIGVSEAYVAQKAAIAPDAKPDPGDENEYMSRRFFCALMLADLLQETPVRQVAQRYSVEAGQIQNLQNNSAQFSYMMMSFTESMGWTSLQFTIQSYVKRLGCGVRADCAHLTEIRGVQASRARCLFNAGYRTVAALAKANPDDVLQRVKTAASKGGRENPTAKYLHRGVVAKIVSEANVLLQQQIDEKRRELELLAQSSA